MKRLFSLFCGLAIFAGASTTQAQIDWATGAPGGTTGGSIECTAGSGIFLDTGIAAGLVGGNVTDGGLDYTISMWIKSSEDDGSGNAVQDRWYFGTGNQGIHLGVRNGNALRHGHWGADNSGTSVVLVNTWVHAAFAFDVDGGTDEFGVPDGSPAVTIYRDGVSEGTFNSNSPNVSDTNLIIGSRNGAGEPGWGGCIDDVAIFTSVLSATDVAALHTDSSQAVTLGAVAYYDFEDSQAGSTAANLVSGSGLTDSNGDPSPVELVGIGDPLPPLPSVANWETGAPGGTTGGSISFDGTGFIPTGIASGLIGNNRGGDGGLDYTISAWIKTSVGGEDEFGTPTGFAADDQWWIGTGSQGLHLGIFDGGTLQQGHWGADSSGVTTVAVDAWVHSTTTFDADGGTAGTGLVSIYYNGVLDSSTEVLAPNRSNSDLIIGARSGGREHWTGCIDDLTLFTTVLSASDVAALHTDATQAVALGAVAYYDFEDAQSGTTAANAVDVASSGLTDTSGFPSPQVLGQIASNGVVLLGDVDLSGAVDFSDIAPFIAVLSGGGFQAEADCDESGIVDFSDISAFINILSGS